MFYLASDDLAVRRVPGPSVVGQWLMQALKGTILALRRRAEKEPSSQGPELIAARARREDARRRVDRLLLH